MSTPRLSLLMLALSALALTACVTTPPEAPSRTLTLDGQLTYLDRMAMPPQAKATVEMRLYSKEGEKLLASTRQSLAGRQLPIPFSIEAQVPSNSSANLLELRAAIELDGRVIRVSEVVPVFVKQGRHNVGEIQLQAFNAIAFGTAWLCGDTEVMLGATGSGLVMRVGVEQFAMQQTQSASGVRYEALGDSATVLHGKGTAAVVAVRGTVLTECEIASEPAQPFTASGNEPPWQVIVEDGRLALTTAYGAQQQSFDLLQTDQSGTTTRYRAAGSDQAVVMTASLGVCHDSMTGMPHPYSVDLASAQGVLRGCGGAPLDLLTRHDWVVTLLDDQLPASGSSITLRFSADDGRVSGNASCNRFNGGFSVDGENLRFARMVSTMMACPEPLMAQEREFLEILSGVHGFDIDANGSLALIGSAGRLTARPAPGEH